MKKMSIFIFLIALFGIGYIRSFKEQSEADRISNKAIAQAGKILKKKYHLKPIAIGGGEDEGIYLLTVYFNRNGSRLTREEARKLIVDCSEDFLKIINENAELRPYLRDFPFTADNIDLSLFCYDEHGEKFCHPSISVVSCTKGKLSYATRDPNSSFAYQSYEKEPYNEGVAILKQQQEENESP